MKTLELTMRDIATNEYKSIYLPTSNEEIEDYLERLSDKAVFSDVDILDTDGYNSFALDSVINTDIYGLNHLAEKLSELDTVERYAFDGVVRKYCSDDINQYDLINYAYNIADGKSAVAIPATNRQDLAEYYLDCNLIPEIKDITGDAWQWICDHTDYEELGAEIEQDEQGIFTADAYVTFSEPEKLYDNSFRKPPDKEYVFKLDVITSYSSDDNEKLTLTLPTDQAEINQVLTTFQVEDFSGLKDKNFKSIVPVLQDIDFSMTDIETLNQLASLIEFFKENNCLTKFKAMIYSLDIIDLEKVMFASECVGDFVLSTDIRTTEDYGKEKLKETLPEELIDSLDVKTYGNKVAEKDGTVMTEYGAVISKDGNTLEQKIAASQTQTQYNDFSMQMS